MYRHKRPLPHLPSTGDGGQEAPPPKPAKRKLGDGDDEGLAAAAAAAVGDRETAPQEVHAKLGLTSVPDPTEAALRRLAFSKLSHERLHPADAALACLPADLLVSVGELVQGKKPRSYSVVRLDYRGVADHIYDSVDNFEDAATQLAQLGNKMAAVGRGWHSTPPTHWPPRHSTSQSSR